MALCGMMCIPNFIESGVGVQTILKFTLRILRGCNVGITEGRDL
jgi:hypothetical protein